MAAMAINCVQRHKWAHCHMECHCSLAERSGEGGTPAQPYEIQTSVPPKPSHAERLLQTVYFTVKNMCVVFS